MKLWVNVCFHYVEDRVERFKEVIKNLSTIPNIKIIINSNVNFDDSLPIHVSNPDDPFHLTWEHKKYMPEFLESDYTHFAFLEGNIEVTKKTFDYWNKTRKLFKDNHYNFIPGVHRVQIGKDNQIYSLDFTHQPRHPASITIGTEKFISPKEPYQGMFIMDRELVEEHINSNYFNVGQKDSYGIRESANLGNAFVNVPPGFNNRIMLPINNFSDTWVTHFGTNYHDNTNSPHAKIKTESLTF